jgi:hypothetical protein
MRELLLLPTLLVAAVPASAQDLALPEGDVLEVRADGDLNGDGVNDIAYLAHNEESRALTVMLSVKGEFDVDFRPEVLILDPSATPSALAIEGKVLKLEEMSSGTTVFSSTHRFRYDGRGEHMRLIGMDATVYSRTFAHDGFEASWNLLNGDATTRELKLNTGDGDEAYKPGRQRSFKRRIGAQWLSDAPDPETFLEEMRDG